MQFAQCRDIRGVGFAIEEVEHGRDVTSLSNLGCALVQGVEMGRSVTPYRITLSYGQVNYVVHVSTDGSLTQICDSKIEGLAASTPAPPKKASDLKPT